jgi:Tfp pilus assembly protein PilF
MGQRLQGMVTVRRADEADMPAALDRALEALQRNDVAAAIAEIEQVSEAPPDEIESWLTDARKRRDAQAGLDELSDAVLRQFAGRQ